MDKKIIDKSIVSLNPNVSSCILKRFFRKKTDGSKSK